MSEIKKFFFEEFKTLKFAEITPEIISGNKEYDENFFKQLDIIENSVLDGEKFNKTAQDNNLKIITIDKINAKKEDKNKNIIKDLADNLFNKVYNLNSTKTPEVIKLGNKFYLAEISKVEKNNKLFNDPDVQEALNAQINFTNKIEKNASILKDISMGAFNEEKFKDFALKNDLIVKDYKIKDLKQNEIFSEEIIKRIFLTDDNQIDLITNNTVTKNYLILVIKTQYKDLNPKSNEYEQFEAKARLNLINKIYLSHDRNLNSKYKVDLNQRTIERVKNSF